MAPSFVYSLHGNGKITHIGDARRARCGLALMSLYVVTDTPPPDRPICRYCTARQTHADFLDATHSRRFADRDTLVTELLVRGLTDADARLALRMSVRTFSRAVNDAMRRAGAPNRFVWGFRVGARLVQPSATEPPEGHWYKLLTLF